MVADHYPLFFKMKVNSDAQHVLFFSSKAVVLLSAGSAECARGDVDQL
jgi:hypothetical protein